MRPTEKKIQNLLQNLNDQTRPQLDQKILDDCLKELSTQKSFAPAIRPNYWRIIMKTRITKLTAAAAVIVIAAFIGVNVFDGTPAYAIEQTIEAMRSVVTVHFFARDWQDRKLETWIKVNPETGENDCHYLNEFERDQISISTPEITYFYHPKENLVRIVEGQALRSDIRFGRYIEDILDKIIEPEDGKVQIIKEHDPNTGKEVMILRAVSSEYEMEVLIDPETKLPFEIHFTKAIPGQIIKSVDEIYYNEELPENLFDFAIPKDAQVIREQPFLSVLDDPNYGILSEGLTRDDACVKIIKEFWDHVINKDFESAHRLLPVANADKIESVINSLGGTIELVSIGEPFEETNINFGILTPVRVRFSDGRVLELYQITHFRTIDGKSSCVLAGEGKPSKRIE